ncbi:GNAT family N-acetyltransferase [Granulicella sp. 5B5]|uniref:GNAT family N-acetyltransferase n=1 Tax=Granulicella sp. 5B5 TaxID=1617967 RepID=UPI0015F389C7|nr:N-acetyltransferase [Granulicella sp. 5B5]QMV19976.1 GNAT family N-acetyltransferase [Granulicella sp. 5B5]
MQLRSYRPSDLDAMVALDDLCFEEAFRFSRAEMRRYAEAKRARVVVAESGAMLAGFCILQVERAAGGPVAYVVTLDVRPELRRQGLASRLMLAAAEQVRRDGCRWMVLHVYTGNAAAIGFYERLGFEVVGTVKGFYGPGRDALAMRAALPLCGDPPPVLGL